MVNRILQQNYQCDQQLRIKINHKVSNNQELLVLQQLSIDVATLNMIYQTAVFGTLTVYMHDGRADILEFLDQNISSNLDFIMQQYGSDPAQWPEELFKISNRYRFIRPHVIAMHNGWVPALVNRYSHDMSEMITRLIDQHRKK